MKKVDGSAIDELDFSDVEQPTSCLYSPDAEVFILMSESDKPLCVISEDAILDLADALRNGVVVGDVIPDMSTFN